MPVPTLMATQVAGLRSRANGNPSEEPSSKPGNGKIVYNKTFVLSFIKSLCINQLSKQELDSSQITFLIECEMCVIRLMGI